MRHSFFVLLLSSSVLCAAPQQPEATRPTLLQKADAYLQPLVATQAFSGSILLARDGNVLERSYGLADRERGIAHTPATQCKLMSVTKSFTALAVMHLVQDGELGLDDRVGSHLPGWPKAWRDVTVHDLLDHTSGIANLEPRWVAALRDRERGLPVWRRLAEDLADEPLQSLPGTKSAYSNFGYVLLGLVIEAASGRAYADYLRAAVLEPAGMTSTQVDDGSRREPLAVGYFRGKGGVPIASKQDMSRIEAAGGLFSTVQDLYRLDRALRGDAILDAEHRRRLWTPRTHAGEYACGWLVTRVHGRHCLTHSGGANGYVADYLRFPDDDACVVVVSNFSYAPIGRISRDLTALLFDLPCAAPRQPGVAELAANAGAYRSPANPKRTLFVRRSGDALLLFDICDGVDRVAGRLLVPVEGGAFLMPRGDGRLVFAMPAEGQCPSVRQVSQSHAAEFLRTDTGDAAWTAAVGDYATQDGTARIARNDDGLDLQVAGEPITRRLAPVSPTAAIALYDEAGGTMLRLELDAAGHAIGFHWQRPDGKVVRGRREGR
jgi:CubicO group peptidase (beta-lactamase class C family)